MDNPVLEQLLLTPVQAVIRSESRVFWLFLVSSLVLALLVFIKSGSLSPRLLLRKLCNPRYWLHASSLTDIKWLYLNSWIKTFLLLPILTSHLGGIIFVATVLQHQFQDPMSTALPYTAIMLLFTGVFFVAEDFSRFYLHRLMHKVPLLWRFHKLHHSATVLTPLTLFRVHPVEMCLYQLRQLLVVSLIGGSFVWFFGGQVSGLSILGVDALGFLFNLLGANLRHSHIPLSFGRFEKYFISPRQHQIHHSNHPAHIDKNFGTCLALWDRGYGTWHQADRSQTVRFGLTK